MTNINVLVTGAKGFVGKNLCVALRQQAQIVLYEFDLENSPEELKQALGVADIIFHLAGVNRPKEEKEYQIGNVDFTSEICSTLQTQARSPDFDSS